MLPKILSITMAVTFFTFGPAHGQGVPVGPPNHGSFQNTLFVSPAGEPFRSDLSETNEHPIDLWFTAVDRDGDATLSLEEFRDDFKVTFAKYDEDGNEQIDAFEVRHYETQIFPEIMTPTIGGFGRSRSKSAGSSRQRGGRTGDRGGKGGRGGKGRSENSKQSTSARPVGGAARFGLLPIYHPLLDADSDISWRVSIAEFMKAADDRFRLLDTNQTGTLTLGALKEKLPKRRKHRREK